MSQRSSDPEHAALAAYHDIVRRVHANDELEPLLEDIARAVGEVLGFGIVLVNLRHPNGSFEVVAEHAPSKDGDHALGDVNPGHVFDSEFERADSWGLLKFVPAERYEHIEGAADRWTTPRQQAPVEGRRARHTSPWHPDDALFAPLHAGDGRLVGVLSVDDPPDGLRPARDVLQLLEMFAVQAGLAVDRAWRQLDLLQEVRLTTSLHRVSMHSRHLDLESLLRDVVHDLRRDLGLDSVVLRVFGDEGEPDLLVRLSDHGPDAAPPASRAVLRSARRAAERGWQAQRVLRPPASPRSLTEGMDDTDRHLWDAYLSQTNHGAHLFVPIGAGTDCLGYLVLASREDRPWGAAWVDHSHAVGVAIGHAVHDARVFARERQLVRELRALDEDRRDQVAAMTHELRTPLTVMTTAMEMLDESETLEQMEMPRASMRRSLTRMRALVDDLLEVMDRADPAHLSSHSEVDLAGVADKVAALLTDEAQAGGHELVLERPARPAVVTGDARSLETLVSNLVANAVKYSPDPGQVTLGWVGVDGGGTRLWVADHGIGISPADQQRLFTEFFRSADPRVRARPGNGLGLRIVDLIARRHHARVDVDSEPGRGTTFTVHFPASTALDPRP